MMKAYRSLSAQGAQARGEGTGRLATAEHLCGALVGLINPGLVGISLGKEDGIGLLHVGDSNIL